MFQIPWYIDHPLVIGLSMLVPTALFIWARYSYSKEGTRFRMFFDLLLKMWPVNLDLPKKQKIFRVYLTSMFILCLLMSIFSFSVATNLIKNGDQKKLTVEQLQRLDELMRRGMKETP